MTHYVFIGRFQPLHKGHDAVIRRLAQNGTVAICVGSKQERRTFNNPLSYQERVRVLKHCYPNIRVFGVPDVHDDEEWARRVQAHGPFDIVVSGNDWTQRCFEQIGVEILEQEMHDRDRFEGTYIRERICDRESWKHLIPNCALTVLEDLNFTKLVRDRQ